MLQHELLGTCESLDCAIERLGLDVSEETAADQLLDGNSIERCESCEWWFESSCLEENNGGLFVCDSCLED